MVSPFPPVHDHHTAHHLTFILKGPHLVAALLTAIKYLTAVGLKGEIRCQDLLHYRSFSIGSQDSSTRKYEVDEYKSVDVQFRTFKRGCAESGGHLSTLLEECIVYTKSADHTQTFECLSSNGRCPFSLAREPTEGEATLARDETRKQTVLW